MVLTTYAILAVVWTGIQKARQRKLAISREPMSSEAFVEDLIRAGVRADTAAFVHEQFEPYYHRPLTPVPSDRLQTMFKIDPENFDDVAELYWRRFSLPFPSSKEPVVLPSDPTLLEFAVFLDGSRDAKG